MNQDPSFTRSPGVERTLLNIDSDRADGSFTGISDKTIHMGNGRTAGLESDWSVDGWPDA
jgi:hypothetical protein